MCIQSPLIKMSHFRGHLNELSNSKILFQLPNPHPTGYGLLSIRMTDKSIISSNLNHAKYPSFFLNLRILLRLLCTHVVLIAAISSFLLDMNMSIR